MTELISIWRLHSEGEEFGEFLANTVAHGEKWDPGQVMVEEASDKWERLMGATHSDLLRWARERFGLEE